jgi:hypothetical protein
MKTIKLLTIFFAIYLTQPAIAQVDLAIGNVNGGYDSYNSSTGKITGVYFDALNNENGKAASFRIAIFLVDPNDFNTRYEVHSINDSNGQNGNTVVEYTGIDIDFNNNKDIPEGDYRLLVWIDVDKSIFETTEDNNALYLTAKGSDLSFTPSSAGIQNNGSLSNFISAYPNPAFNEINFSIDNITHADAKFIDITGRTIKETILNQGNNNVDISDFATGIYYCQLLDADKKIIAVKKIVKE